MKKEEKKGQKAKKEKQGAIRSVSGKIERTAEPPSGQEKREAKSKGEKLHPRLRKVRHEIRSNLAARKAMKDLVAAGCDETALVNNLFYYCGGTEEEVKAGLKAARKFRDQLGSISERLVEDADAIETIMKQLEKQGGIVIHGREYAELPSTLRDLADLLARSGKAYKEGLRNVRIEKDGSITGGRNQHLVYLAHLVRAATKKEHYIELAKLVAAVQGDTSRIIVKLADAIRSAINRYRTVHFDHFLVLATEADAEASEWRAVPQEKFPLVHIEWRPPKSVPPAAKKKLT